MSLFTCEREKQIFNEFTGNNHTHLAKNTGFLCRRFTKL
ncbi:Mor transcription activator family protein [Actinobacillus capsulatus]|nr:Mor transcription activator family protein [Actinobacillus capsulatus]